MKKHLLIAVLLCGLTGQLYAKESAQYRKCMSQDDAVQGVHPVMMECVNNEIAYHDKRLNAVYQQLMKKISATQQQQLRQQQRAWIKQRDAIEKKVFEESGSGQAGELNSSGAVLAMTEKRADELERRFNSLR